LKSRIFKRGYFDFQPGPQGDCRWRVRHRTSHCLIRNYEPRTFTTFHDSGTLNRLVRDASLPYDRFRQLLEQAPHGTVHAAIGGPGGDMTVMTSPNDPIFWLHHSFIDKIWADHQRVRPRSDYGGRMRGRPASLRDIIRPFNMSVKESLDIDALCYAFQPFSRARTAASHSATALTPLRHFNNGTIGPIIPPNPLPSFWIQEHGFNETEIRENEVYLRDLAAQVNTPIMQENARLVAEHLEINADSNISHEIEREDALMDKVDPNMLQQADADRIHLCCNCLFGLSLLFATL
jgi:Common central domain of tyrosinase